MKKITILVILSICLGLGYMPALADEKGDIHNIAELVKSNQLDKADKASQDLVKQYPNNSAAHWVYANVALKEGYVITARKQLNIAQTVAPGLPYVNANYAISIENQLAAMEQELAIKEHKRMVHRVILYLIVILILGTFIGYLLVQRKRTKDEIRNRFYPKNPPKTGTSNPVHHINPEYVRPTFQGSGVVINETTPYYPPAQVTVINNDNSFVDGLLVGEMLNQNNNTIIEQPIIEPQQVQEPSYPDPDPIVSEPDNTDFGIADNSATDNTPDTDFGTNSSSDYGSDSSSDFGTDSSDN